MYIYCVLNSIYLSFFRSFVHNPLSRLLSIPISLSIYLSIHLNFLSFSLYDYSFPSLRTFKLLSYSLVFHLFSFSATTSNKISPCLADAVLFGHIAEATSNEDLLRLIQAKPLLLQFFEQLCSQHFTIGFKLLYSISISSFITVTKPFY